MLQDLCEAATSVNFSHSQDGEGSEVWSPSRAGQDTFQVKCFNCHGTSLVRCQQCRNTGLISSQHPMAQLLNQVLLSKMSNSYPIQDSVPVIREEEQFEQKKWQCQICGQECEQETWGGDCCQCYQQKASYTANNSVSKSVCWSQNNRICCECETVIDNCYSVCTSCKQTGVDYWLCDHCSDQPIRNHNPRHLFETVLQYNSDLHCPMQAKSEDYLEDESADSLQIPEEIVNGSLKLKKRNSSIVDTLQISQDFRREEKGQENGFLQNGVCNSQVKVDFGDAFSDFQLPNLEIRRTLAPSEGSEAKKSNFERKKKSRKNTLKACNSEQEEAQQKDFIFEDYQCDCCLTGPILNVRYHCQTCLDYDLCQKCMKVGIHGHPSCHILTPIDGKGIHKSKKDKIFQIMDQNLLRTRVNTMSKSANASSSSRDALVKSSTRC